MRMPRPNVLLSLLTLCASAGLARAQSFTLGDLFLYTPVATGLSSIDGGVLRIDPTTGASTMIVDLDGVDGGHDAIAYDPFRDRLLFSGVIGNPLNAKQVWAVDALGNAQSLGHIGMQFRALAPTGDGRVYFRPNGPAGEVQYLDATNQLRTLMDSTGTQPFRFEPGGFFHYTMMLYHAPTQSLIVAGAQTGCGGTPTSAAVVRRVAVTADGSRALGPIVCSEFEVSTSGENPVGLSLMDDGDLLLVVDTNSNADENRMVRVDPTTLAMTPFASNGGYLWPAATNAGTFSTALGQAIILNTGGDDLRAYGSGASGLGTPISTTLPVSPSGSSGEIASLIQIRDLPCGGSVSAYGTGLAGNGGFVPNLSSVGCPVPNNTFSLLISSANGGAPGLLAMGSAPLSVPLFGGTLLVVPEVTVAVNASGTPGAAGTGSVGIPIPLPNDPSLSGVDFYFQAAFLDAAAPEAFSLTGGLHMTIG